MLKLLLDAVCAALGCDDSQIDELHVFRSFDPVSPRADVRVLWDALPWHCAWCEPPPGSHATSGICGYHSARGRRRVKEPRYG